MEKDGENKNITTPENKTMEQHNAISMSAVPVDSGITITLPSTELNGDAIYLNYRQLQSLPSRLFDPDIVAALCRLYLKHNLLTALVILLF